MAATAQAVLAEARTWRGTPFVHAADVKRQGVDCGMLVLRVYQAVGLLPDFDPRPYPPGWWLHRTEDRFTPWLLAHAVVVDGPPQPADIACFRMARAARGHLAIVTAWPRVLHADMTDGVAETSATHGDLSGRFVEAWRVRGL